MSRKWFREKDSPIKLEEAKRMFKQGGIICKECNRRLHAETEIDLDEEMIPGTTMRISKECYWCGAETFITTKMRGKPCVVNGCKKLATQTDYCAGHKIISAYQEIDTPIPEVIIGRDT